MPQDQTTGAAGDSFGRETAPLIAQAIGATMVGTGSNEATYKERRVVIKCAAKKTASVGVTYCMLKEIHGVVGAFQRADGTFEVVYMPARIFEEEMKPTRSQGASAGKVGVVRRSIFFQRGKLISTVRV